MDVGLDIGTGFVKASGGGKQVTFPSLYAYGYSEGRIDSDGKEFLKESVGTDALHMGRKSALIRPVKDGLPVFLNNSLPSHEKGFMKLVMEALSKLGVKDPSTADIAVGITYDAKQERKKIRKAIISKIRPASCVVVPQAYGTLVSCQKDTGMVVNIGHGTTEIMSITPGSVDGISIEMASDFVMSRLDKRRGMYVHYERLLTEEPERAAKFISQLADHIGDELSRMMSGTNGDVILAGGGSRLPGLKELLEKITGVEMTVPEDPVFSNAVGLEKMVAVLREKNKKSPAHAGQTKPPAPVQQGQPKPVPAHQQKPSPRPATSAPPAQKQQPQHPAQAQPRQNN